MKKGCWEWGEMRSEAEPRSAGRSGRLRVKNFDILFVRTDFKIFQRGEHFPIEGSSELDGPKRSVSGTLHKK